MSSKPRSTGRRDGDAVLAGRVQGAERRHVAHREDGRGPLAVVPRRRTLVALDRGRRVDDWSRDRGPHGRRRGDSRHPLGATAPGCRPSRPALDAEHQEWRWPRPTVGGAPWAPASSSMTARRQLGGRSVRRGRCASVPRMRAPPGARVRPTAMIRRHWPLHGAAASLQRRDELERVAGRLGGGRDAGREQRWYGFSKISPRAGGEDGQRAVLRRASELRTGCGR
jgi:hypothetical protein